MHHTIQKQCFDLWVHPHLDALALQQRVSDRCETDIIPELERRLNDVANGDHILFIETLEVDLGLIGEETIDTGEWTLLFREKLEQALQEILKDLALDRGIMTIPAAENVFNQWCYFIRNGYLPWNAGKLSAEWLQQVLESLARNYQSAAVLSDLIKKDSHAVERIIWQHSPVFLSHLVELLTAEKQNTLPAAVSELADWLNLLVIQHCQLNSLSLKELEHGIWRAILPKVTTGRSGMDTTSILLYLFDGWLQLTSSKLFVLINRQPVSKKYVFIEPVISRIIKEIGKNEQRGTTSDSSAITEESGKVQVANNIPEEAIIEEKEENPVPGDIPGETDRPIRQQVIAKLIKENSKSGQAITREQATALKEGVYLHHAGLVLLHPFLTAFFRKLGLTKEGRFIDENSQERAICLLHELAEPGKPVQEYNLVLEKLLCGWPLHQPIDTAIELTEVEKDEAQHLLEAVIAQWEILKNSTPAALQETFLQREGKLVYKNEKWYLQVEKRSVDLLLAHLPWMISMIKLPWVIELLMVEWT